MILRCFAAYSICESLYLSSYLSRPMESYALSSGNSLSPKPLVLRPCLRGGKLILGGGGCLMVSTEEI